jgi:hypothetical protein
MEGSTEKWLYVGGPSTAEQSERIKGLDFASFWRLNDFPRLPSLALPDYLPISMPFKRPRSARIERKIVEKAVSRKLLSIKFETKTVYR